MYIRRNYFVRTMTLVVLLVVMVMTEGYGIPVNVVVNVVAFTIGGC